MSQDMPGHEWLDIEQYWVDQVVVVAVCGEVDMVTSAQLTQAIDSVAAQTPAGVIVDLTKTTFLASAGFSVLLNAHARLIPTAAFGIVADGPATSRPLTLMGLDRLLMLYRTVDDALRAITAG